MHNQEHEQITQGNKLKSKIKKYINDNKNIVNSCLSKMVQEQSSM